MSTSFTFLTSVVLGCAVHLLLSRDLFRILLGAMMLTNGANLAVILLGGTHDQTPSFVPEHAMAIPASTVANPLPQALVLTAIVIGFAIFAFALTLVVPLVQHSHTLDVDSLPPEEDETDVAESSSP